MNQTHSLMSRLKIKHFKVTQKLGHRYQPNLTQLLQGHTEIGTQSLILQDHTEIGIQSLFLQGHTKIVTPIGI